MSDLSIVLESSYYNDFLCKGSKCWNNCCHIWKIDIDKEDYWRLMNLDCSDTLHNKIAATFVEPDHVSDSSYRVISFNSNGVCPLLDSDGLCMIHKECGGDALHSTCKTYPRRRRVLNDYILRLCSTGCEKVVEQLVNADRFSFKYNNETLEIEDIKNLVNQKNSGNKSSTLEYLEILCDRKTNLEQRIGTICNEKFYDNWGKTFFSVITNLNKINKRTELIKPVAQTVLDRYKDALSYDIYCNDLSEFYAKYPKWEIYFENVLVNHLLCVSYPDVDSRLKPQEAKTGLQYAYEIAKVVCVAYTKDKEGTDALIDALACIFRHYESSSFYYNIRKLAISSLFESINSERKTTISD